MITHVLMITSFGSTPYFFFNSDKSTVASKALIEDILSANRQFIGRVGASSPSNLIFLAWSWKSFGRLEMMVGFSNIPRWKTFLLSSGTEYMIVLLYRWSDKWYSKRYLPPEALYRRAHTDKVVATISSFLTDCNFSPGTHQPGLGLSDTHYPYFHYKKHSDSDLTDAKEALGCCVVVWVFLVDNSFTRNFLFRNWDGIDSAYSIWAADRPHAITPQSSINHSKRRPAITVITAVTYHCSFHNDRWKYALYGKHYT